MHFLRRSGELLSSVVQALMLPQSCVICHRWVADPRWIPLCRECAGAPRPLTGPRCHICGVPVDANVLDEGYPCSRCRTGEYGLDRVRAWGRYDGPLRELIQAYKYDGIKRLAPYLGERLSATVQDEFAGLELDGIVPVPLHPSRRRSRGFDQTLLLARQLSRRSGIPVWRCVRRTRATLPQVGLSRAARRENVRGAFAPAWSRKGLEGARLLILDDILTTGATLEEVAGVLRRAGAVWLGGLAVGRA
jgi:ComF family protein